MYRIDTIQDGGVNYFLIRDSEDLSVQVSPTRYLKFRTRSHRSPNTVKRSALSIVYYLDYLKEKQITLEDVYAMNYDRQFLHFIDFLDWIRHGWHKKHGRKKKPQNATCNAYLKEVFQWLLFRELQGEAGGVLKVRQEGRGYIVNTGNRFVSRKAAVYKGFLKEEHKPGKGIDRESIRILIGACSNLRDKLILLLLAETGLRIGELLGIHFAADIDFERHAVRVCYREDNTNGARAKNQEQRSLLMSDETFRILLCYISEYHNLLLNSKYLFIIVSGRNAGEALQANAVYALMKRLEKKTGIKASPHMFRRYFARERQKSGWDILLISRALGHRMISTTQMYLDDMEEVLEENTKEYFGEVKGFLETRDIL